MNKFNVILLILIVVVVVAGISVVLLYDNPSQPTQSNIEEQPETLVVPIFNPNDSEFSRYESPQEFDECKTDNDCVTQGCSLEKCVASSIEPIATTCETIAPANARCGCTNSECIWIQLGDNKSNLNLNQDQVYNSESWKEIIPDTCMRFYDGCNECFRQEGSNLVSCTEIGCETYSRPKCLDETVDDSEIAKGKTCEDSDGLDYYTKGALTICDFETYEEPGATTPVGCAIHEDFCPTDTDGPTETEDEVDEIQIALDLEYSAMAAALSFTDLLPFLTVNDGNELVNEEEEDQIISSVILSNSNPNIGETITVDTKVDMTEMPPPTDLLGSFTASLSWDTDVLNYVSHSDILSEFIGVVNVNAEEGAIKFNGVNPTGTGGVFDVLHISFDVIGTGEETNSNGVDPRGKELYEYYCVGDEFKFKKYSCPSGCQNGACIN